MFSSILTGTLTFGSFMICIGAALVLGLIIALVHMKTSSYSKNFASTLAVIPALVAAVIMMVNGNLGTSIAVLGSFSLIRFRSIPGNSKEIINVFFAMAVGLAAGTGYIGFASIITVAIGLFMIILNMLSFGENASNTKVLKIDIPEDLDYITVFDDIFKSYTNKVELTGSKTINMGSMYELTYRVNLKNSKEEKKFIDEIRVRNGNLKVSLSHPIMEGQL